MLAVHRDLDARLQLAVTSLALVAAAQLIARRLPDIRAGAEEEAPPRFALPPRSALAIGLVGFCAVFAEGASMDWSGIYLRDVTSASDGIAAAAYTAFALTMTVSRLAGDAVIGRLGPVPAARISGAIATLGGVLVIIADTPYLAIPGFALIGIGIAIVVPLAFAAAGRSGGNASQAIAGVATVTYTSGLIAPAVIGAIAQATSLTVSFGLVTALTAALVLSAGALRQPAPADAPERAPATADARH